MNLWKRMSSIFGGEKSSPPPSQRPSRVEPMMDDEAEITVPELSVEQLQAALASDAPPLLIDVREPYEWRLVRMAPTVTTAMHIPMNDVPGKVDSLPHDRELVVMCAHGSRSYSVAAWLIEQGFHASSLSGGITQWAESRRRR